VFGTSRRRVYLGEKLSSVRQQRSWDRTIAIISDVTKC
jgi:hypothetical protein